MMANLEHIQDVLDHYKQSVYEQDVEKFLLS